jgi:hypothetical protein
MNTKLLMISSSVLMGMIGIISSFLPEEILVALGQTPTPTLILIIQTIGALYLGFAFMNWMAKTALIGGIYAKPLCVGNLVHFLVGGLVLFKGVLLSKPDNYYLIALAILYALFAVAYGIVFMNNPQKVTQQKTK